MACSAQFAGIVPSKMIQTVPLGTKQLADYASIVGRDLIEEIHALAEPLQGHKVLHLSATAYGGGVAEILYTLLPLMRDIGLDAQWQVIYGQDEFFSATKQMHNSLQGDPNDLTPQQWADWKHYNELNAEQLSGGWDTCIVHDPQPAAIMNLVPEQAKQWVWRCHIDLSTPNPDTIRQLLPYIADYPESVFHMQQYVPEGMNGNVNIVPPAIDPLAPKNMAFSLDEAAYICHQFGIDVERPLVCQVSRFDPWKDPLGVIDSFRLAREEAPDIQLALIGSMASDDPEGWEFFNATVEHAAGDPDIHILNNFNNVGAIEVNAFQSHSDVLIQKSTREGFGLTVSEALWKARPFIGGDVGGIPLQITDGASGYLVSDAEQCAARTLDILRDPVLGATLGKAGKEHVRKHFLTPRLLRDWLKIISRGQTGS